MATELKLLPCPLCAGRIEVNEHLFMADKEGPMVWPKVGWKWRCTACCVFSSPCRTENEAWGDAARRPAAIPTGEGLDAADILNLSAWVDFDTLDSKEFDKKWGRNFCATSDDEARGLVAKMLSASSTGAQAEGDAQQIDDEACKLCGEWMPHHIDENRIWVYACQNTKCLDEGKPIYSAGRLTKVASLPKPEARPEGEAAGFRKMSRPDKSRMYWAIFPHVPRWGPFIVAHFSGEPGTIIEDKVGWVRLSKVKNYPNPHGWSLYWVEPSEILFGAEVSPAAPEASIWDAETIKDAPEANDARVYQFDSGYGNGFGNMLVTKSDCLRILAELQARGGPGYEIMVKVPNPIRFFGPHSQPPAPSTTEKEG